MVFVILGKIKLGIVRWCFGFGFSLVLSNHENKNIDVNGIRE